MNETHSLKVLTAQIAGAWAAWWHVTGKIPLTPDRLPVIAERLKPFAPQNSDQRVRSAVAQIAQGKCLVEAALQWHQPTMGPLGKVRPNITSQIRGEQWRFVSAYCGFERIFTKLMSGYISPPELEKFFAIVPLGEFEKIAAPAHPTKRSEGFEPDGMFKRFLAGQSIENWTDFVMLAKKVRDACSHGVLSPSKVKDLEFRPVVQSLLTGISQITIATINRLALSS